MVALNSRRTSRRYPAQEQAKPETSLLDQFDSKMLKDLLSRHYIGPDQYIFSDESFYIPLVEHGLVEVNADIKEESDSDVERIATRATPKGAEMIKNHLASKASEEAVNSNYKPFGFGTKEKTAIVENEKPVEKSVVVEDDRIEKKKDDGKPVRKEINGFVIEDNVPLPESKKGVSGRTSVYPFEALEVGQSFFVPATGSRPNPAKQLASTVSSAIERYSVKTGRMKLNRKGEEVPEKERTRMFVVRAVEGGARIWRTK